MTRRALTLIEVLAATVLLSIMVAAVLPTLTSSMATLHHRPDATDLFDLSRAADAFLTDPAVYGFKNLRDALAQDAFEFSWNEDGTDRTEHLHVQVLRSTDADVRHVWLVFKFVNEDQFVMRWAALPPKPKERSP